MSNDVEFIGLDGQIDEIPSENAGFVQIQNLSYKMVKVTDDAYILGRAFGLVRPDNQRIAALVDKGVARFVDTPKAKIQKQVEKPKSRKKVKREEAEQQSQVLESLNHRNGSSIISVVSYEIVPERNGTEEKCQA
jgi:hypothetical protein